jgi:hypothetical protein
VQGRAEGRAEGLVAALLAVLAARAFVPTADERARVDAADEATLSRWLAHVATCGSVAELIDDPGR